MGRPEYREVEEKLRIRVHAHTAYANLRLEDWLVERLKDCRGCRLLEIGCGHGNFFPVFARALDRSGVIVGLDKNIELLKAARDTGRQAETPGLVFQWDFDHHPFPLLDDEFDIVISLFSAYYTIDVREWLEDALRVLKPGGVMFLLGPTADNARELKELNRAVSGIESIPETDETAARLESQFLPELLSNRQVRVNKSILDRQLIFPSPEEYARYYFATWLYERTRARIKREIEFDTVLKAAEKTGLRLNKRVICIEASKRQS